MNSQRKWTNLELDSYKTVLIACPVYKREWILPDWFEALENQNYPLEKIGFIFELGNDDDATHEVLYEWHEKHPQVAVFDGVIREDIKHHVHPDKKRYWDGEKYMNMVYLRNSLLDRATCLDFDCYFSLDSDIILSDPNTLKFLADSIDYYDVVSPLAFMTPTDDECPSVMWWYDGPGYQAMRDSKRMQYGRFFQADIVMAAKMMSKEVYKNVRYMWHKQGEDLGFAANLHRGNFRSYCASQIYAFHAMYEDMLTGYKNMNCIDPRNPNLRLVS